MEFASVTGASSGRTYMALWNTLHYNPLKSLNTLKATIEITHTMLPPRVAVRNHCGSRRNLYVSLDHFILILRQIAHNNHNCYSQLCTRKQTQTCLHKTYTHC